MFEELPETLPLQLMLQLKEELVVGVPMPHDAAAKTVLRLVKGLGSCIAIPGEPGTAAASTSMGPRTHATTFGDAPRQTKIAVCAQRTRERRQRM
jgi:hypothetical protein